MVDKKMGPKRLVLRLPPGLYEGFLAAAAEENKGLPPFAVAASMNTRLVALVAEYVEFWTVCAQTAEGKVLRKGLKGARRG